MSSKVKCLFGYHGWVDTGVQKKYSDDLICSLLCCKGCNATAVSYINFKNKNIITLVDAIFDEPEQYCVYYKEDNNMFVICSFPKNEITENIFKSCQQLKSKPEFEIRNSKLENKQ